MGTGSSSASTVFLDEAGPLVEPADMTILAAQRLERVDAMRCEALRAALTGRLLTEAVERGIRLEPAPRSHRRGHRPVRRR